MRYRRMRRKEAYLKNFFASLDPTVVANRKRLHRRLRRANGEPHASALELRMAKDEPVNEESVEFGVRRYKFDYGLYDDGTVDE